MPATPTPRLTRRCARFAGAVIAALAATALWSSASLAAPATYKGSSADGTAVFFETEEQMVPGDTDTKRDVYERSYDAETGIKSYVTREVSLGPVGGNDAYNATFERANKQGTRVFFSTAESLVEADTDHSSDVYMRELETGTTTLVSQGEAACAPACGNGPLDAGFAGINADGTRAFFVSEERLTGADKDGSADIYARNLTGEPATETTELVSSGESSCLPGCGNGAFDARPLRISPDGSYAYFTTAEPLSSADHDEAVDIYARNLGEEKTTLVSQAAEGCSGCGDGSKVPVFRGSSEDGSRVFFTTDEKLVEADGDGATDIYARDLPGGPTRLISGGTEAKTVTFAANSGDGEHVFFNTAESLVPEDKDSASDLYEWSGGNLGLVVAAACGECEATFDAASADSETVLFSTAAKLSPEDSDGSVDIYSQQVGGGEPVLVSRGGSCGGCGNGPADAQFDRASADASHVVFNSLEALSPEDGDSEDDIYARVPGEETSLITTSPSYCPLRKGSCGATFAGASTEGSRVFFTTVERFTLEDGDDEVDVYERFLGTTPAEDVTRLVSAGNSPDLELGPPLPKLEGTNPASPAASTSPKVFGEAQAGSTVKLYGTSNCSGEPVAHGSAAQLASPGIGVSVGVGETAKFWATAEAEGFVSLCGGPVSYRQENAAPEGEGGGGGPGGGTGGKSGSGGAVAKAKTGNSAASELFAYVTPHTRITFAPAAKTRSRSPVFRFTDATGQPGTRFSCKVDRHPWKRCSSPLRLKKLARGRHALEIKAVNAVGTPEPHPSARRFRVVPR
ncbi:MAG TPA: hypothetical protein VGH58_10350 [Solirubrobacterales bacterium]|jgi:Tol biopolymer transport system component